MILFKISVFETCRCLRVVVAMVIILKFLAVLIVIGLSNCPIINCPIPWYRSDKQKIQGLLKMSIHIFSQSGQWNEDRFSRAQRRLHALAFCIDWLVRLSATLLFGQNKFLQFDRRFSILNHFVYYLFTVDFFLDHFIRCCCVLLQRLYILTWIGIFTHFDSCLQNFVCEDESNTLKAVQTVLFSNSFIALRFCL